MNASSQPASVSSIPPVPIGNADVNACTRYIARQPILNREQGTHGYELLFRSGPESFFRCDDPDADGCQAIDFSMLFGSSAVTGGQFTFVNCTRSILLRGVMTVLPRDRVVIEVPEDVLVDQKTIGACDRLHHAGYQIALDDYVPTPDTLRLIPFADIVKVDFQATDAALQAAIAADMRRRGIILLAQNVETREQFHFAQYLGFHYFQGYFFCWPESLAMQDVSCSTLAYLEVLSIAYRDFVDVDMLVQAILREPFLCNRLLRYLYSAAFGLFPIRSIRNALLLMDQSAIRKWISIAVAISLSSDRPEELIYCALVRARCCEVLAGLCGEDSGRALIVGIMSLMDAMIDRSREVVISHLPLAPDCGDALGGGANTLGNVLQVAIGCERGTWAVISRFASERGIPEEAILNVHSEACRWASVILQESRKQG